jgi:threonine/homoserine/homoserine lactone efflux protein
MEYISIFFISFTIALSGALMPGPLLAKVVAESSAQGAKTGPLIILGHAFLEIIMIIIILTGLERFLRIPVVLKVISIVGAVILLYLGLSMLWSLPKLKLNLAAARNKNSSNLVFLGVTMSLANPYWTIWWLTIGIGLLFSALKLGVAGIAVFFGGHILADLGWYAFISLMVSKGRRFLSDRVYRWLIGICAVLILGFALYFGISSWQLSIK